MLLKYTTYTIFIATTFTFACTNARVHPGRSKSRSGTQAQQEQWLKELALCNCLVYATGTKEMKGDISRGIYMDIANYSQDVYDLIDSVSKNAASKIAPSQIADHDGKKALFLDCMNFYNSQKLDSLVRHIRKQSR